MITYQYTDVRQRMKSVMREAAQQPVKIRHRTAPDMVLITAEQFEAYQQREFDALLNVTMADPEVREFCKVLADK